VPNFSADELAANFEQDEVAFRSAVVNFPGIHPSRRNFMHVRCHLLETGQLDAGGKAGAQAYQDVLRTLIAREDLSNRQDGDQ
jgi:hypothetical protein